MNAINSASLPEAAVDDRRSTVLALARSVGPSGPKRSYKAVAAAATVGSILFGYDTGVISGALPYMQHPAAQGGLGLSPSQEGLVGFFLLIGAAVGALGGGRLSDRYGRRHNLMLLAAVFLFGALATAFAPNVAVMYPARFVLGLAVGGASATVPVYLAETAPKEIRGTLVAVDQFMIVTGQMLAFAVNAVIANTVHSTAAWRYMLVLCSVPAVVLWIAMRFMPESARWLAARGEVIEAIGALKRVRTEPDGAIADEIVEAEGAGSEDTLAARGSWRDLSIRWIRIVILIGVGMAVAQQVTGINTIMYYAPKILMAAGQGETAAITSQVANGVISLLGSAVGLYLMGRLPRRRMIITGLAGITGSLVVISAIFLTQIQPHLLEDGNVDPADPPSNLAALAVLGGMMVFLCFFQVFLAPASWVLLSEIFPQKMRGLGMGIAIFCLWVVNAIITWVFPIMIASLGGGLTFAVFAGVNVLSVCFAIRALPETRNLTLGQLEAQLERKYS